PANRVRDPLAHLFHVARDVPFRRLHLDEAEAERFVRASGMHEVRWGLRAPKTPAEVASAGARHARTLRAVRQRYRFGPRVAVAGNGSPAGWLRNEPPLRGF